MLRTWRKVHGFSQEKAARAAGVRQNTWSDWENGHKTPQGKQLGIIDAVTNGAVPIAAWADVSAADRARIARVLKAS